MYREHFAGAGFELTTFVVIGTDYIGSVNPINVVHLALIKIRTHNVCSDRH